MMIREPTVAGMFYPRESRECEMQLKTCLDLANETAGRAAPNEDIRILGGVVPHAGWICSGAVAATVFQQIARRPHPSAIIIFGAAHRVHLKMAALFPSGAWETPLGLVDIDERLAERLQGQTGLIEATPHAHEQEHSIEVQLPFIKHLLPDAKIVPLMVPPNDRAVPLGRAIGNACRNYGVDVVFIASTDLTHYGPNYNFTPHGVGPDGLDWAKDVNDRRMIDAILAMREQDVLSDAAANLSACGAGAVAACIAASKAYGATHATLLQHTTSHEVLTRYRDEPACDAVGYAAIMFD